MGKTQAVVHVYLPYNPPSSEIGELFLFTKVHAFSRGLAVQESPEQGRFVVTKTAFTAGDVLASEPAGGWPSEGSRSPIEERATSASILLPFQRHVRCAACHSRLDAIGYVCWACNDAAFCGPPSACFAARSQGDGYDVPQWHKDECR